MRTSTLTVPAATRAAVIGKVPTRAPFIHSSAPLTLVSIVTEPKCC
jgi:hypothetical protein